MGRPSTQHPWGWLAMLSASRWSAVKLLTACCRAHDIHSPNHPPPLQKRSHDLTTKPQAAVLTAVQGPSNAWRDKPCRAASPGLPTGQPRAHLQAFRPLPEQKPWPRPAKRRLTAKGSRGLVGSGGRRRTRRSPEGLDPSVARLFANGLWMAGVARGAGQTFGSARKPSRWGCCRKIGRAHV